MRRVLIAGFCASALAAAPAFAAPPKARSVVVPYTGFAGANGPVVITEPTRVVPANVGFIEVPTLKTDRTVTVSVTDQTGLPVAAVVGQLMSDAALAGGEKEIARICGATAAPLKLLAPGRPVTVTLIAGTGCALPSLPTAGKVSLTLR